MNKLIIQSFTQGNDWEKFEYIEWQFKKAFGFFRNRLNHLQFKHQILI